MRCLIVCIVTLLNICQLKSGQQYITNGIRGGRLGDKLLTYIKAKLVHHYYQIPFYLHPSPYFQQLSMNYLEPRISNEQKFLLKQVSLSRETQISLETEENILYECNLLFRFNDWLNFGGAFYPYVYTIKHPEFKQDLLKNIHPVSGTGIPTKKKHKINVAVHIRKGGGFDLPLKSTQYYQSDESKEYFMVNIKKDDVNFSVPAWYFEFEAFLPYNMRPKTGSADMRWKTKFPPEQFYVDAILKLSEILKNPSINIEIFTDDDNSEALVERIKKAVNKKNISFSQKKNQNYKSNFIQDLFAMAEFDCLIRPDSNFSNVAQILGNHNVIIWPLRAKWVKNKLSITHVGIIQRDIEDLIRL